MASNRVKGGVAAAVAAAVWLLWASNRPGVTRFFRAFGASAGLSADDAAGASPIWSAASASPTGAAGGPRALVGDWRMPGGDAAAPTRGAAARDRMLIGPGGAQEEAHVIPSAPDHLMPLELDPAMRAAGEPGKKTLPPQASTATARAPAAAPAPAPAPPRPGSGPPREPPTRTVERRLIPIPEATRYGIREASSPPTFRAEPAPSWTTEVYRVRPTTPTDARVVAADPGKSLPGPAPQIGPAGYDRAPSTSAAHVAPWQGMPKSVVINAPPGGKP